MTIKNLSLPIILHPNKSSKRKTLRYFIGSLAFFTVALAIPIEDPITRIGGPPLFGLCTLGFGVMLLPKASFLELTEKGFTTCTLFCRRFIPWTNVQYFYTRIVVDDMVVCWRRIEKIDRHSKTSSLSKILKGEGDLMVETCGLNAEDLASLLNTLLKKSRADWAK